MSIRIPADQPVRATRLINVVGKVPVGFQPGVALQRLAEAAHRSVAAAAAAAAATGADAPKLGAPRVGRGASPSILVPFEVTLDTFEILHGRLDGSGHLRLAAPWGGAAAVYAQDPTERRSLRLLGIPACLELSTLRRSLTEGGLPIDHLIYTTATATGAVRFDVATCTVPVGTRLPEAIAITFADRTSTIYVHAVSTVPAAPDWGPPPAGQPGAAAAAPAARPRSFAQVVGDVASPASGGGGGGGLTVTIPGLDAAPVAEATAGQAEHPTLPPAGDGSMTHTPASTSTGGEMAQPAVGAVHPAAAGAAAGGTAAVMPASPPQHGGKGQRRGRPALPSDAPITRAKSAAAAARPTSPAGVLPSSKRRPDADAYSNAFAHLTGAADMDQTPADLVVGMASSGPAAAASPDGSPASSGGR